MITAIQQAADAIVKAAAEQSKPRFADGAVAGRGGVAVDSSANQRRTDGDGQNVIEQFSHVWDNIHGPGSWEANPWVAAYTFERVTT